MFFFTYFRGAMTCTFKIWIFYISHRDTLKHKTGDKGFQERCRTALMHHYKKRGEEKQLLSYDLMLTILWWWKMSSFLRKMIPRRILSKYLKKKKKCPKQRKRTKRITQHHSNIMKKHCQTWRYDIWGKIM